MRHCLTLLPWQARYWRVVINLIWNMTDHEGCAGWLWLYSHWAVCGKIGPAVLCWKNDSSSQNNFVHVSRLLLTDTKSVENQVAFTLHMLQSQGTSARRLPLFGHAWRQHFPLERWRGPFTLTGSLGVCCQASVMSCDVFDVVSHFDVPLSLHLMRIFQLCRVRVWRPTCGKCLHPPTIRAFTSLHHRG